jgi:hypothetical protein
MLILLDPSGTMVFPFEETITMSVVDFFSLTILNHTQLLPSKVKRSVLRRMMVHVDSFPVQRLSDCSDDSYLVLPRMEIRIFFGDSKTDDVDFIESAKSQNLSHFVPTTK